MGSSHFGEPGLGNGRSGSSSSRKGKKSTNSDKPKQPQRGLGVAQLERMRLNKQMNMNRAYLPPVQAHYPFHPNLNQDIGGVMRMETGYAPVPAQAAPAYAYPSQAPSPHQFSFHPMMGMGAMVAADNVRFGGNSHQPSAAARWSRGILENQYARETKQLFGMHMEESAKKREHDWFDAMGSSSQKSSSSENDEIDLDLKLSL